MDETFVTLATIFLTLVGAGCLWGIYSDLKDDRGRSAHEWQDSSRTELPLNFCWAFLRRERVSRLR